MKCVKCGEMNKEKDKFCANCGAKLEKEKQFEFMSKLKEYWQNKTLKFSLIIVLLLLSVIIYFACFHYKSYEFQELYDIKVEGVNGYGTLKITKKENLPSAALEKLVESVSISTTKDSELKNGDIITITIGYSESISKNEKVKINKKYQYKVKGLEAGQVLDLFENLEITYSSKSPYLKIELKNEKIDSEKYNIHYQVTSLEQNKSDYRIKKGFYQNGEKIKVKVTYDKEMISKDGYIVPTIEKELEIPKEDTYISDTKELTKEKIASMVQRMSERMSEYATAENIKRQKCSGLFWCYDTSYERIKDPELVSLHFGYKEDVQSGIYFDSSHTTLIGTYKITYGSGEIYCNVSENNFYLTKEGTFSEFVDGDRILCSHTLQSAKTSLNQNYRDNYRYEFEEVKN